MMTGTKSGVILRRMLSAGAATAALVTGMATAEDINTEEYGTASVSTGIVLTDYERRQIEKAANAAIAPIQTSAPLSSVPVQAEHQPQQSEKRIQKTETTPDIPPARFITASSPEPSQDWYTQADTWQSKERPPAETQIDKPVATKPKRAERIRQSPKSPDDPPASTDQELLARIEAMLAAQQAQIDAQEQRLAEQEQEILQQKSIIVEQQRQLISYANDVNTIGRQVAQVRQADQAGPAARDGALRGVKSRGRTVPGQPGGQVYLAQGQTPQAEASSSPPAQDAPERIPPQQDSLEAQTAARPQSEKQVDQLLLDTGGVLLPKGSFQLEPSFDYTAISSDRVNVSGFSVFNAILIGTIRVDDLDRDILSTAVTGRYGITNRLQAELRVPAVYRNDREVLGIGTGDVQERKTEGYGLGDVSASLSWQPISAKGWRPATIFKVGAEFPTGKSAFEIERIAPAEDSPERVLAESPTGSGFYAISPGVTFVWPADPVVIFAGGAYTHTPSRDFGGAFGEVDPGDGFEYFLGMNLSLNERTSTNFNFVNKRRFVSKQNNFDIIGSGTNDARLGWGLSSGLNDRVSLVLNSTIGLTDESPDYTVSVRMPIKF